jgi:hypothetical protein
LGFGLQSDSVYNPAITHDDRVGATHQGYLEVLYLRNIGYP